MDDTDDLNNAETSWPHKINPERHYHFKWNAETMWRLLINIPSSRWKKRESWFHEINTDEHEKEATAGRGEMVNHNTEHEIDDRARTRKKFA